eukprot:353182-Chlamydomonas_euryale.AAC.19
MAPRTCSIHAVAAWLLGFDVHGLNVTPIRYTMRRRLTISLSGAGLWRDGHWWLADAAVTQIWTMSPPKPCQENARSSDPSSITTYR